MTSIARQTFGYLAHNVLAPVAHQIAIHPVAFAIYVAAVTPGSIVIARHFVRKGLR
jgi:hypothetical protein